MKKLVLLSAAVFTSYFAQAQTETTRSGIKLGIKAGANLSSLAGKDKKIYVMGEEIDSNYKFSFHGGFFADFGISDMVSFRPEVLYSGKGYKSEYTLPYNIVGADPTESYEFDMHAKQKVNYHYIDVPALAHINVDGLFFEMGPTASFLVHVKSKSKIDIENINGVEGENIKVDDQEQNLTDSSKKVDFGYAAGLGYETTSGLGIGLRYNGGLSKVFDNEDRKVRNANFQLSLSYIFRGI